MTFKEMCINRFHESITYLEAIQTEILLDSQKTAENTFMIWELKSSNFKSKRNFLLDT